MFDRSGVLLRTLPRPGVSSDDFDLDVADEPLVGNGDGNPDTVFALDRADDTVLASVSIGNDQTVGLSYNPADGLLYSLDWDSDLVRAFDLDTGAAVGSFPVQPVGAPGFTIFYGDLNVDADGNLQLVTDTFELTRVLITSGEFVQDFDLGLLLGDGDLDLTGITFDNDRGEAWMTSRGGLVYQLAGLPVPEPASLAGLGLLGLTLRRRR